MTTRKRKVKDATSTPVQRRTPRSPGVADGPPPTAKRARTSPLGVPINAAETDAPATVTPGEDLGSTEKRKWTRGGWLYPGNLKVRPPDAANVTEQEAFEDRPPVPFEPTYGYAGHFGQDRELFVDPRAEGVIVQHVSRALTNVREGGAKSDDAPVLGDPGIEALVGSDAGVHPSTHEYLEAWDVSHDPQDKPAVDVWGLGPIASAARVARADPLRSKTWLNTTSGQFTIRGDARFYATDAEAFRKRYGFRPSPEGTTAANGLAERPLGRHRGLVPGRKRLRRDYPVLNSLDDIDEKASGRVTHEIEADWDTFTKHPETKLTINGEPWVEPEET